MEKLVSEFMTPVSQSLLNQGNIQIKHHQRKDNTKQQHTVSIPFKSGKYSNIVRDVRFTGPATAVSIPFKSGKYSNMEIS